jgi:hypothetical protein
MDATKNFTAENAEVTRRNLCATSATFASAAVNPRSDLITALTTKQKKY